MQVFIVTAFPNLFESPLHESIVKRAQEKNCVRIHTVDLRRFTSDKHKQVDDYSYGGVHGMGLNAETRTFDFAKNTILSWERKFSDLHRVLLLYTLVHEFLE